MSAHWSLPDDAPASGDWKDDAVSAWQNYGNHSGEDDTPDEIATEDLRPTEYDGVYADANNKLWSIQEDGDGQIAVPTTEAELAHEALEEGTLKMILAQQGHTLETADQSQMYAAALQAQQHISQMYEAAGAQHARGQEQASMADEIALGQTIDAFIEEHGSDPEEATPYLEMALQSLENGTASTFEEGLQQASAALTKWHGEVNTAAREDHFASKGYERGIKEAFAQRRREAAVPAHRAATTPQKAVPPATGPFGNPDAHKVDISNRLSNFMQGQREKAALKDVAEQHVRNR